MSGSNIGEIGKSGSRRLKMGWGGSSRVKIWGMEVIENRLDRVEEMGIEIG